MRLRSLTTRFLLTLSLSAVLPALVLGVFVAQGARARLHRRAIDLNLVAPAGRCADRLVERLENARSSVARLQKVAESYLDGELEDFEFDERVYDEMDVGPAGIQGIVIVDEDGSVLRERFDFAESGSARGRAVASVAEEPWFRRLMAPDSRELVVWISRHLSPFRHANPDRASRDPADYSLGIASLVPTRDGRGVFLALLRWTLVQDVLDATVADLERRVDLDSARAFLLPPARDRHLAHTERERYGTAPAPPLTTTSTDAAGRVVAEVGPRADAARARDGGGSRAADAGAARGTVDGDATNRRVDDGVSRGASGRSGARAWTAALVPADDPGGFGWWVGVGIDDADLDPEGRTFFQLVVLITGATALLLVAWSLFASRAIVRPIGRLVSATEAVGRGEFGVRVDVPEDGDELADLGRAFNRMSAELAERGRLLAQAERRAAWAEMARQVAHEIKNPLTPMRMGAQLALRARAENDPRRDALDRRLAETVLAQTDELRRIADDFRAFAGSAGQPASARERADVDAARLVHEVADAFRATAELRGVAFEVEADAVAGVTLRADVGAVRRLLINLVQNAFDAVSDAGDDDDRPLDTARESAGTILVAAEADADRVVFRVRDDGPGIEADVRERLFDPYFTTRSRGTGLGLAICRRIVEDHDGTIEVVDARPGTTEFRVALPRRSG